MGFAIVTAVLMSVPDRQQGMDDINCTMKLRKEVNTVTHS